MWKIVLLVLFVMSMFLWFLALVGSGVLPPTASSWVPFIAVLILGILFVVGAPATPGG